MAKLTKDKIELIEYMINNVLEEAKGLTKWEEDFIDSIAEQFEMKQWLSDKQQEILERIYAEKTK